MVIFQKMQTFVGLQLDQRGVSANDQLKINSQC